MRKIAAGLHIITAGRLYFSSAMTAIHPCAFRGSAAPKDGGGVTELPRFHSISRQDEWTLYG